MEHAAGVITTRYRLPSRTAGLFGESLIAYVWSIGLFVVGLNFLWMHELAYGGLLAAVGAVLTFLTAAPTGLHVGADGVEIRWLGRRRFLPYDDIAQVEHHIRYRTSASIPQRTYEKARGILIQHTNGETFLVADEKAARDAIVAIREHRAKLAKVVPADLIALHRGERPVTEWTKSLGTLLRNGEGYRASGVTQEALWKVLENPKSDHDARAAAAIALRSHLGEEATPRIRIAIEACAAPKLRVALEAIAHGDEEAIGATLEDLRGSS